MKRTSTWNTFFGALVGSLPPLLGYVAAMPLMEVQSPLHMLSVPVLLFLWQFPHFYGLSWKYQDEYRNAGFAMVSRNDPNGRISSFVMGSCAAGVGLWTIAMAMSFTSWMVVPVGGFCMLWMAKSVRLFLKAESDLQRQKVGIYVFKVSNYVLLILLGAIFLFSHKQQTSGNFLSSKWRQLLLPFLSGLEDRWETFVNVWIHYHARFLSIGNEFCIHTKLIAYGQKCPVKLIEQSKPK